ncbi:MAG: 16S rRNA (cytosine(967)-C(5))-methyltransferase RsmB, partial [Acidimicrobiales bacterium]
MPSNLHPKTAARLTVLRALQNFDSDESTPLSLLDEADIDATTRGFAREILSGTLRHLSRIDWTIQPLLKKPIAKLDAPVRAALRLAAYEIACTRTPAQVAGSEYAGLMRQTKTRSAVAFVNAIARRLPAQLRAPDANADAISQLAIETSHPRWLVERWEKQFGIEATRALCAANNQIAPLNLRANTLHLSRDEALQQLQAQELNARASEVSPHGIVIERAGSPLGWELWQRGDIIAQDEAAQLVALHAAPQSGQIVMDVASAPGGKSTHLAQLMNDKGRVIAADRAAGRLKLVRENASRLGLKSVETFDGDAQQVLAAIKRNQLPRADIVLLDAPCSGTGTLRRRPDLKWRKSVENIAELVELQRELLDICAQMVKPGGALVYSTCALEVEENQLQAQAFTECYANWRVEGAASTCSAFADET